MKTIPLTQDKFAIVDDEEFEKLNQFKWHARKANRTYYAGRAEYLGKTKNGYRSKTIHMHREVLRVGSDISIDIDHINGNGLDNRKENLRIVTKSQNRQNIQGLKSNNTSGFRGVIFDKESGKYRARISNSKGGKIHLGRFKTAEDAAKAFDQKAIELYGEFCGILNFPKEIK